MGSRVRPSVSIAATLLAVIPAATADPAPSSTVPERAGSPAGTRYATHGPDTEVTVPSLEATKEAIACVPRSTPHFEAIVARAYDDRERPLRSIVGLHRQAVYDASHRMDTEAGATLSGARARYRALCTGSGEIVVHRAVLPTPKAWDTFSTVVRDLERLGYARAKTKYLVFYDDCASVSPNANTCFSGGVGTRENDDRLVARNLSTRRTGYGVDFGAPGAQPPSWYVTLHESGHTMGAVQDSAPHYSGGGHCWDGADIMCYSDGGYNANAYNENACPRPLNNLTAQTNNPAFFPWDCGLDDYFNPDPPAGSYLATHWNLGHRFNVFLAH